MDEEKKLLVCLRCEDPELKSVIQVEPLVTIGELKKAANGALKQAGVEYTFVIVSYGHEPIELSHKKDAEPAYLRDRSTLFCIPPSHRKPAAIQAQVEEEVDEKAVDDGDDDYAGFSADTILTVIPTLKGFKKSAAQKYADSYASEVIVSKPFLALSKQALIEYISRDSLSVDEAALFEAVVAWAKAQLGEEKKEAKVETLSAQLTDILPHVRFLTMSTEDIAAKVAPTGLLDGTQILELFTYLAIRGKADDVKVEPGPTIRKWKKKPRKGRAVGSRELAYLTYHNWAQLGYCFDVAAKRNVTIVGLSVMTRNAGTFNVSIWWKRGSNSGYCSDQGSWQTDGSMQSMVITSQEQQPVRLPCAFSIKLAAGEVCSFYLNGSDSSTGGLVSCSSHDGSQIGTETASDDNISLLSGASHNSLWSGERSYSTGLIGIVHYG